MSEWSVQTEIFLTEFAPRDDGVFIPRVRTSCASLGHVKTLL